MTLNYIICYGFWIVYFMDRVINVDDNGENDRQNKVLSITNPKDIIYIDATIKLMACLNSALNGIVHIARGSQIRSHIYRIFTLVLTSLGSENANPTGATTTLNTHVNNNSMSINNSKSRP